MLICLDFSWISWIFLVNFLYGYGTAVNPGMQRQMETVTGEVPGTMATVRGEAPSAHSGSFDGDPLAHPDGANSGRLCDACSSPGAEETHDIPQELGATSVRPWRRAKHVEDKLRNLGRFARQPRSRSSPPPK